MDTKPEKKLSFGQRQWARLRAKIAHQDRGGGYRAAAEYGSRPCRWLLCFSRTLYLLCTLGPLLLMSPLRRWRCTEDFWWRWAVRTAERSGAVVIKLAQWASSRPDFFGEATCARLRHLMDRTPLHSWRHTEATLRTMFGSEWEERLRIERTPIGSGCIAQVYRGEVLTPRGRPIYVPAAAAAAAAAAVPPAAAEKLAPGWKEATDEVGDAYYYHAESGDTQWRRPVDEVWTPVAVKVLHPGVRPTVAADMDLLRLAARMLTWLPGVEWLNPDGLVEDFGAMLMTQMDLRIEADNLHRFLLNFPPGPHGLVGAVGLGAVQHPLVHFPIPIDEYCTSDVLVETFLEGEALPVWVDKQNLSDGNDEVRHRLCNRGIDAFLQMLFHDNFVHGDLHPGNILVTPDGHLAFIDAGIALTYTENDHQVLIDLFTQFLKYDGRGAAEVLLRGSEHAIDTEGFKRKIEDMVLMATTVDKFFENVSDCYAIICGALCDHHVRTHSGFMSIAISVKAVEGAALAVYPHVNMGARARGIILREHTRRKVRKMLNSSMDTMERVHDAVMTKEGLAALTADARAAWETSLYHEAWERLHNSEPKSLQRLDMLAAEPSAAAAAAGAPADARPTGEGDDASKLLDADAKRALDAELRRARHMHDFQKLVEREVAAAKLRRAKLVTALQGKRDELREAAAENLQGTANAARETADRVHAAAVDAAARLTEQHELEREEGRRVPTSAWKPDFNEITNDIDLIRNDMRRLAQGTKQNSIAVRDAVGEKIKSSWVTAVDAWRGVTEGVKERGSRRDSASSTQTESSGSSGVSKILLARTSRGSFSKDNWRHGSGAAALV